MKKYLILLLGIIINSLSLGCRPQYATTGVLPQTPTIIPLATAIELIPTRKSKFENTLVVEVDKNSISFLPSPESSDISGYISLEVIFFNKANFPVRFRKPQLVDILSQQGSGSISDLTIAILRNDNKVMMFDGLSKGMIDYDQVSESDYVQIEPHNKFVFPVKIELSWVFIPEDEYIGKIPNGAYHMIVTYENYTLGYGIPLIETPPANLSLEEEFLWKKQNKKEVDLDAWIGIISSEEVEFTISE